MKKTILDMSSILNQYTEDMIAEGRRRQELRDRVAAGDLKAIAKWGQMSSWNISDRH